MPAHPRFAPPSHAPPMPRFLIEVAHDATTDACVHAAEVFLRTGSHYLTHADWGCKDGDHKSYMIMELDSKRDAMNVVPADFRARARVVQLNAFTADEIAHLKTHLAK